MPERKKLRTMSTYIRRAAQCLASAVAWDAYKIPGLESTTRAELKIYNGDDVIWSKATTIQDFEEDDNEG